jgi:serine/threonine protein kinase
MSDLIGKTIGQYQVVEFSKDTGSTWVYKGFQPNMNRYVTIQVLKAQDEAAVRAFQGQSDLLAGVQGPNILPIIDSGISDHRAYRVFQFAEKGSLKENLFEFYGLRKATGLISGVVAGLEMIHAEGSIHGNLSSDNIYLSEGNQALLSDFGLPVNLAVQGSPYQSPEQVQGSIVDRRTDVYGLGVLLYEILIGETPPPGLVMSPRAKRADIPVDIEKVIFRAMAPNPDARFQSVREFQNALTFAIQPGVPTTPIPSTPQPAMPTPAATPPPAQPTTNWTAIFLSVMLVIILCGGIGLIFGWWNNQDGDVPPVEPTSPPAEVVPTAEPPEPTSEPSPTEDPGEPEPTPEVEQPIEPPPDTVEPITPGICNAGGFAGGVFILGSFLMIRRHAGGAGKKRRLKAIIETQREDSQ